MGVKGRCANKEEGKVRSLLALAVATCCAESEPGQLRWLKLQQDN